MPPRKKVRKVETMTKEAASIIKSMNTKQYLDEIIKLKNEMKRLDKKIIEKEIELNSMGKDREEDLNKVEAELNDRESSIRALHLKVDKDRLELEKEIDHFKDHEKIIMKSLKATDIQVTLAREKVNLHRIEIVTKEKDLKDREATLKKEKATLCSALSGLNLKKNSLKIQEDKLNADKSKLLNNLHNLGKSEKALKDREETQNLIAEDLLKQLDKSTKLQDKIDKQLDKINKLRADVEIAHENNVQSSTDNAVKEKELEDLERDLQIRSRALSVRKDELDRKERDLRILQKEK